MYILYVFDVYHILPSFWGTFGSMQYIGMECFYVCATYVLPYYIINIIYTYLL